MSQPTYLAIKPFMARLSITQLAIVLRAFTLVKVTVQGFVLLTVFVTAVQFFYPPDHARPFIKANNTKLSFLNTMGVSQAFSQQKDLSIKIEISGKTINVKQSQTGITTDNITAAKQVTNYPLAERIIPFTLFKSSYNKPLPQKVDSQKLKEFSNKIAQDNSVAPVDAVATKKANGQYDIRPSINGKTYSQAAVMLAIKTANAEGSSKIKISPLVTEPKITTSDYQATISKLDAKAKQQSNLYYGGKTYLLTGDLVRQWSVLVPDTAKGAVNLTYDKTAIKIWLDRTLPSVLQTPKSSIVSIVDGVVAGRSAAQAGVGLDSDASAEMINKYLADQNSTKVGKINLATKALSAREIRNTSYTPTSGGLQAVIADWQKDHPGLVSSVSFIEIGGLGRQASLNPNALMPAASLYKIYVSLYLLKGIEAGTISAADDAVNGKNIAQCIEAMFVFSDNPCGETLAGRFGWQAIDNFAAASGFGATVLNQSPVKTTASDAANYLVKLQSGQLLSAGNTAQVLDYMSRQVFRSAIPAGSPGAAVSDKVGFTGGIWNDAAIVRGQRSTYVLVVMTQNGNPSVIKDLALRIHNLIDP